MTIDLLIVWLSYDKNEREFLDAISHLYTMVSPSVRPSRMNNRSFLLVLRLLFPVALKVSLPFIKLVRRRWHMIAGLRLTCLHVLRT